MINLFRIKLFTNEQFIREQFSFFEEAKSGRRKVICVKDVKSESTLDIRFTG